MAEKRDKSEVDYSRGKGTSRCLLCEHYIEPRQCELVAGDIRPDYWCRLFKKAQR